MNIQEIIKLIADSEEFKQLVHDSAQQTLTIEDHGREIKRSRFMEPAIEEGEWLLNNTHPAGDD